MKKKIITGVVLGVIFIVSLILFSSILNRGMEDTTADMGGASLPLISFEESGYTINELVGYTEEMEIPSMRDTILPVSVGTSITANINGYAGRIYSLTYEIRSLDGSKVLKKETFDSVTDSINIELGDSLADGEEKVLKISMKIENDKSVHYYMRLVRAAEFSVQQCLEFAEDYHNNTFVEEGPNGWGTMEPKIAGDVRWQIKEANATYTSIYLKYQVKTKGDAKKQETYNVTEFLKVRFLKGAASLEDYNRTMHKVFSGSKEEFDSKGILLGNTDKNVPYLVNEPGDVISFVQEREVWSYNKKENEISLVFSFADAENQDVRNYNDDHSVRLIEMDKKGNTTFAVYGYMNRGDHEGQVGAAIYYFDIEKGYVEEKAFIPSRKSGEIAKRDLEQLVYYSKSQNMLYVMLGGSLYQVDLESEEQTVLVENLEENQYVASKDGKCLAYQSNGSLTEANAMEVWNLKSGKNYTVHAAEDEILRPLGFVLEDVVYGVGKKTDIGKTVAGETVIPLYKLEIRNAKNTVEKTYQENNAYILDAEVEHNMVTLQRVQKTGKNYSNITPDYITNNKEQEKQTVKVDSFTREDGSVYVRLTDEKGLGNTAPKLLKPKQVVHERPTTIDVSAVGGGDVYYTYGYGKLQGIYEKAGEAILAAEQFRGVVVTSKQTKIWERGNRMLRYNIDDMPAFAAKFGETSLEASVRKILELEGKNVDVTAEMKNGKSAMQILNEYSGGEALDLTGCTLEELFYIIGKGTPVIAMTGNNSAILMVGYDDSSITYLNPKTGRKPTESLSALERKVEESQGTFIGYVK